MRDAFGGSFMLKIFLVFIIVYIGFTALALNYAKAFKVKNKVIEYIENNEITDFDTMPASVKEAMEEYFEKEIFGNMNYRASITCENTKEEKFCENGIQIIEKDKAQNTEGIYYEVNTTIGWKAPFINKLLALDQNREANVLKGKWKISGETRLIVRE